MLSGVTITNETLPSEEEEKVLGPSGRPNEKLKGFGCSSFGPLTANGIFDRTLDCVSKDIVGAGVEAVSHMPEARGARVEGDNEQDCFSR